MGHLSRQLVLRGLLHMLTDLHESRWADLQQRIVCTGEDCLRLLQRFHLAGTSLLASIVVLEQPIALLVQTAQSIDVQQSRFLCHGSVLTIFQQVRLQISLRARLVLDRLRVARTLVSRVFHEHLVLFLSVLLLHFHLLNLLFNICYQHVDHRNHSRRLFTLLLVSTLPSRRSRSGVSLGLREDGDASAGNAARSLSWGGSSATELHSD